MIPVQEHHEIRQNRVGVDAAGADLAHQVHAHGVAAKREEGAVAERKNSAITPDQVDRKREQCVAGVFSPQRNQVGRHVERRFRRQREVESRHRHRQSEDDENEGPKAAVEASSKTGRHASTARPLSANSPRGRFWMNRMISTRIAILPSTAPATGSRNLLAMPSVMAPTRVPNKLPTPPNTTTMKLSMM